MHIMKNILSALLASLIVTTTLAQTPGPHAASSPIADLLSHLPAQNRNELDATMQKIPALGEDGLTELALRLAPGGGADNTGIEYALAGYSRHVTQPGKEALRATATRAYSQALEKITDKENKAFIIRQLAITGKDDAVPALRVFLNDDRLAGPAARALAAIHTPDAGEALLEALPKVSATHRAIITQALGDMRYAPAAASIRELASSSNATAANNDARLRKAALYALGRIGEPGAQNILPDAAKNSNYLFDSTEAVASCINYIRQLSANGHAAEADRMARNLLAHTNTSHSLAAHTAALKLVTEIEKEKSIPLLIDAVNDKNAQYREAALQYALLFPGRPSLTQWTKKLQSTGNNTTLKAAIITMLGNSRQPTALPAVLPFLKDASDSVRIHAIRAAAQVGQQQSLPALLQTLKKNRPADVAAIKTALLSMKGDGLTDALAKALPSVNGAGKAALLDVLAARAAQNHMNAVLPLLKSSDSTVRHAAFGTLKSMSSPSDLTQLFTLLTNTADTADMRAVQEAIMAATADIKDTAERTGRVLSVMQQSPAARQYPFYNVLAATGSKEALHTVSSAFASGDEATRKAVIGALSRWPGNAGIEPLYKIMSEPANNTYLSDALAGYIHLVSVSPYPADQRLLLLRRAMPMAGTNTQQQAILAEVQRCKTFPALVYAGQFLDKPELQKQAAMAVMSIALSNRSWNGPLVRPLLEKTMNLLEGRDSDYEKQAIRKYLADMPAGPGIVPLFNGVDLTGWKGLLANPIKRAQMNPDTLQKLQAKADESMRKSWYVKDGLLEFSGTGENLCTVKKYSDVEMWVDWRIEKDGDAGIYLRGSPQVQIWDTARRNVGAQVGSGGLYNNTVYPSKPLVLADNAIGDWNSFHIIMKADRVTVWLNGVLVVNNIILENYWDRKQPIFPEEQIELQAHGNHVSYRDLYIRELPHPTSYTLSEEEKKEGFRPLFDGTNMFQWTGNTTDYVIEDDAIAIHPTGNGHGNLYTKEEYKDFVYRFEFQLTPGANNGIGIRAPLEGDAAYVGMEIQVLDSEDPKYRNLHEYQYHGSVYGVIPAKRGFLKPVGEWNTEEISAIGNHIKVVLNGTTILDGDISDAIKNGTADKRDHPGLKNEKGHLGFLGHGDVVRFRRMRVKDLSGGTTAK